MRNFIKRTLTKTVSVQAEKGKTLQIKVPPNEKFVYGVYFAIVTLCSLTILELTYIIVLRQFNSEIFSAITGFSGTILGIFLSAMQLRDQTQQSCARCQNSSR
jgi:hypothetical protein